MTLEPLGPWQVRDSPVSKTGLAQNGGPEGPSGFELSQKQPLGNHWLSVELSIMFFHY